MKQHPVINRATRVDGDVTYFGVVRSQLVKATLNLSSLAPADGSRKCISLLVLGQAMAEEKDANLSG